MSKDDIPEPPEIPLNYEVKCEIQLTEAQKALVYRQTGRRMDVLILEDAEGNYAQNLQYLEPDDFTVKAIRQAELLNQYDEDYKKYLEDLAEWQDNADKPDEMEELADALSVAAMQEAERLKLFYEKEFEACDNAREVAKIAYGKKKPS